MHCVVKFVKAGSSESRRAARGGRSHGDVEMHDAKCPVFGVPPSRARALAEFKFSTVTAAAALAPGTRAIGGRGPARRAWGCQAGLRESDRLRVGEARLGSPSQLELEQRDSMIPIGPRCSGST